MFGLGSLSPTRKRRSKLITPSPIANSTDESPTDTNTNDTTKKKMNQVLRVRVCRARGLRFSDKNKLSDPFVVVQFGKKKFTTSTKKDTLDPIFNETFEFVPPKSAHGNLNLTNQKLFVRLFDKDTFASDKLGTAELDLSTIENTGKFKDWLALSGGTKAKKATGSIKLAVDVVDTDTAKNESKVESKAEESEEETTNIATKLKPKLETEIPTSKNPTSKKTRTRTVSKGAVDTAAFRLKVVLIEARNLRAADRNGLSDPYAVLTIGKEKQKSKVIKKTLAPKWDQSFWFGKNIKRPLDGSETLLIKLFDRDLLTSDKLGSVELKDIRSHVCTQPKWFQVKDARGQPCGQVHLMIIDESPGANNPSLTTSSVTRTSDTNNQERSTSARSETENEAAELDERLSKGVRVTVLEARNLPAGDRNGTSDPYAMVVIGKQKLRTKSIKKTLAPVWNQTLDFINPKNKLTHDTVIELRVYDDDMFIDDVLGVVSIPIRTALSGQQDGINMSWYALSTRKKMKKKSENNKKRNSKNRKTENDEADDKNVGEIALRIELLGSPSNEDVAEQNVKSSTFSTSNEHEPACSYMLHIGVLEAKDLSSAASQCQIECGSSKSETKTLAQASLEPKWGDELSVKCESHTKNVRVRIMSAQDDTCVGTVTLDVQQLAKDNNEGSDPQWYDVVFGTSKAKVGSLCMSIKVNTMTSESARSTNSNGSIRSAPKTQEEDALLVSNVAETLRKEILQIARSKGSKLRQYNIFEVFKLFDVNATGVIEQGTLERMLTFLGRDDKLEKRHVAALTRRFTNTPEKGVQYQHFRAFTLSTPESCNALAEDRLGPEVDRAISQARAALLTLCATEQDRVIDASLLVPLDASGLEVSWVDKMGFLRILDKAGVTRDVFPGKRHDREKVFRALDKEVRGTLTIDALESFIVRGLPRQRWSLSARSGLSSGSGSLSRRRVAEHIASKGGPSLSASSKCGIPAEFQDVAKLEVRVTSAKGLRAADRNGTSDPYCILKLGKEKFITKAETNTLNPKWNQTFLFGVRPGSSISNDMTLEIQVKDRDILFNDVLGTARVEVGSICGYAGGTREDVRVLSLSGPRGKSNGIIGVGEINLALSIQLPPQHEHVSQAKTNAQRPAGMKRLNMGALDRQGDIGTESKRSPSSPRTRLNLLQSLEVFDETVDIDEREDKQENAELKSIRHVVDAGLTEAGYDEDFSLFVYLCKHDSTGSGVLKLKTFLSAMNNVGVSLRNKHRRVLLPRLDPDGRGKVDYIRFCKLMGHRDVEAPTVRERLQHVIARAKTRGINVRTLLLSFDSQDNGLITLDDVRRAFLAIDAKLTVHEVRAIVEAVDSNRDSHVHVDAMLQYIDPTIPSHGTPLRKGAKHNTSQTGETKTNKNESRDAVGLILEGARKKMSKEASQTRSKVERWLLNWFGRRDAYGTGRLSRQDFATLCSALGQDLTDMEVLHVIQLCDEHDAVGDVNYVQVALMCAAIAPEEPSLDTTALQHKLGMCVRVQGRSVLDGYPRYISKHELRQWLRTMDSTLSEAEVRQVMGLFQVSTHEVKDQSDWGGRQEAMMIELGGTSVIDTDAFRMFVLGKLMGEEINDNIKFRSASPERKNLPNSQTIRPLTTSFKRQSPRAKLTAFSSSATTPRHLRPAHFLTQSHDMQVSTQRVRQGLAHVQQNATSVWDPRLVSEWLGRGADETSRQDFDDLYRSVSHYVVGDERAVGHASPRHAAHVLPRANGLLGESASSNADGFGSVGWKCTVCEDVNMSNSLFCDGCSEERSAHAQVVVGANTSSSYRTSAQLRRGRGADTTNNNRFQMSSATGWRTPSKNIQSRNRSRSRRGAMSPSRGRGSPSPRRGRSSRYEKRSNNSGSIRNGTRHGHHRHVSNISDDESSSIGDSDWNSSDSRNRSERSFSGRSYSDETSSSEEEEDDRCSRRSRFSNFRGSQYSGGSVSIGTARSTRRRQ